MRWRQHISDDNAEIDLKASCHLKIWQPYIYSSNEKRLSPGHCQVVSWKEIYTIYIQTCWSKKSALPLTVWGSPNLIIFNLGFKEVAQEGNSSTCPFSSKVKVWSFRGRVSCWLISLLFRFKINIGFLRLRNISTVSCITVLCGHHCLIQCSFFPHQHLIRRKGKNILKRSSLSQNKTFQYRSSLFQNFYMIHESTCWQIWKHQKLIKLLKSV